MHIRKSYISVLSIVILVVVSGALLFTGWIRSSFAPDWNLQHHWDTWTSHKSPNSNTQPGTGSITEGRPIADEPGISPVKPNPEHPPTPSYDKISIKDEGLRNRLAALIARPVQSHEEALKYNVQACPKEVADFQVNQDQLRGSAEAWASVGMEEIIRRRSDIVKYLEDAEKNGTTLVAGGRAQRGQGIVMTGGNRDTIRRIMVTLKILRHEHKCKLPVQVFSFPGEITSQNEIKALNNLGATVKELSGFNKDMKAWKNFQIKAAAIALSDYREVLYLDSDNIPLADPALLFEEPLYRNGPRAVFWPDFNKDHPQNAIWRVLGIPCDYSRWELESGQIIVDKRGNNGLNLAALHVAIHMAHEQAFYYSLSGGDKFNQRYAFWALGLEYTAAPRWLSSLGSKTNDRFCGVGMVQYGLSEPDPEPFFAHLNLLKHIYRPRPVFTTLERAAIDRADSRTLDRTSVNVYTPTTGGMCAEIKVDGPAPNQKLIEEAWAEAYGGKFKGFEEMFFKYGGWVGGW
ncbi:glycosyltransferase family 71 protein [Ceratobasidium sp. AG-Ba]|nr:glycosyltransferase family 71 protein [Ceratobasidium sp. AG-Ba]